MAWWNILFGGAADLVKAGTGVVTAIAGDQATKDQQLSSEQVALLNAYGAEFIARQQRSKATTTRARTALPRGCLQSAAGRIIAGRHRCGRASALR